MEIPNAEELINATGLCSCDLDTHSLMIKFAKLHVKAALEQAYTNAKLTEYFPEIDKDQICFMSNDMGDSFILDKKSIAEAYPLTNIK